MTKPQILFLYVLFNQLYENHSKEEIKLIFQKGLKASNQKKRSSTNNENGSDDEQEEEE